MESIKKNITLSLIIIIIFFTARLGYVHYSNKIKVSKKADNLKLVSAPLVIVTKKNSSNPIPKRQTISIKKDSLKSTSLKWGAYVGDGNNNLSQFENMIGKKINILADFEDWNASFPSRFSDSVGQAGKVLVIFWEPSFGYDDINNYSQDAYIKQFALDAKNYTYPVIMVPFDEMNLNETDWGYGVNNNNASKFITAWRHIHDIFKSTSATNVKFAIDYNNVSIPDATDNNFADYYPGNSYVDYVTVSGFNFGNPWQTFGQIFDTAISRLSVYKKPMYILSTGSVPGIQKASWIIDMGKHMKKYSNVIGWVWFNSNSDRNWLIDTDPASLTAFKSIVP